MQNGLVKEVKHVDGHTVIAMTGELTIRTAPNFHKSLVDMPVKKNGHWIFDFQEIKYIDSAGVGTLVDLFRRTKKHGTRMSLSGMSPHVLSVFEITKLDKFFPIFDSVQDALDS